MRSLLLSMIGFGATAAFASAQTKPPAFEVASVKLNKSGDNRSMGLHSLPGGRFRATNLPLYVVITYAYNLPFQSQRLTGGPDWVRSERFDIEATAEKGAIPAGATAKVREEKIRLMVQGLLAERFRLVLHGEMKELPVYALVAAKHGPKLKKADIEEKDCPETTPGSGVMPCHIFNGGQGRGLHGTAVDMSDLVLFVANWTDRPIIDRTGIQGLFNIQTDGWVSLLQRPVGPTTNDEGMADPSRPTVFTVFQEQLGLKLDPQKGPVEMFTIESVERPAEN